MKNLTSVGIKFLRITAAYMLFVHKRNEEILQDLEVETVDEKLRRHK
jgi:hypothetical protein